MSELLEYILSTEESFRRARLPSLYSDFTLQRYTNPDGYASNVAAWQRALAKAARAGYLPSHSAGSTTSDTSGKPPSKGDLLVLRAGNALVAALETGEWGRPVALQSVVDEALGHNTMIPLQLFLNSATSPFRNSWLRLPAAPSLSQVASWSFRQVRGLVVGGEEEHIEGSKQLEEKDLVLVDNLDEAAKLLGKVVSSTTRSNVDRIYSKEMFTQEFASIFGESVRLSATDFDVLLVFLSRDRNDILYDGKTIKFRAPDDANDTITEEDQTIASLKTIISSLEEQIANMDKKIREYTLSAQNALNNKNRTLALSALRSKKLAEQNLKQRSDTLYQLEEVYTKIQDAVDQVDIIRVMQASTGALRSLHAQVGGVDVVEDVVEELRKEMGNVEDVNNVISEPSEPIDEGELDEELEAMEKSDREAAEEKDAESTRKKLEDLDRVEEPGDEKHPETERAGELEESIDRMSNMSLDERPGKERDQAQQA